MEKKRNPFNIAAILFLLCLVRNIFYSYPIAGAIRNAIYRNYQYNWLTRWFMNSYYTSGYFQGWDWVLPCIFLIMLCVALFIRRRNVFLVVVIGLQVMERLFYFVRYSIDMLESLEYIDTAWELLYICGPMLSFFGAAVALLLAIANIQKKTPSKFAGVVNNFWFLPGLLYFTGVLVSCSWYFSMLDWYGTAECVELYIRACARQILPTVAWLMLGLWFKLAWKRDVAAAAAEPAQIPVQPVYSEPVYQQPAYTAPVYTAPVQTAPQTTDELREYKKLLDDGVITQEEFDAKKKQLLNL